MAALALAFALAAALTIPSAAVAAEAAPPAEGTIAAVPPAEGTIAAGVRVAGVDVSGMTVADARVAIVQRFLEPRLLPMLVTFKGKRFAIEPRNAGYVADVDRAVEVAAAYGRTLAVPPEGADVPVKETVNRARIRAIVRYRAKRLAVSAVDAKLTFQNGAPRVRKARLGFEVDRPAAERLLVTALLSRNFRSYALPARRVRPAATGIGSVIVIDRGGFRLRLYRGERRVRTYPIAVGTSTYPTPSGLYRIVTKQRNPTWFPPSSPWARGLGPVPPGLGNPLGTRWMGTSAPAIGMHGTPASGSIGTRASHGCIRMYIGDAEDLFDRVEVGTPVLIV